MKCISIFKCNPQIEVIDKSHCSLEDVPNFQNYSRSLEELFLDANKLTSLNDNVFRLTKLRRFSFSDNAIQDIPPAIAKLVNLVELDCSRNNIQVIPEQIKFLRGLQICDFSANNIEYLPSGLVQLKNLTCLTLNYCPIKSLPDDFGLLKNLESLELRENELENLPDSITDLESLRKLDLGRNLLSKLPEDIGRLTNLEYLLVDGNRLETIPPKIGRLRNLQCLDLSQQEYGSLTELPEEIGRLTSLTDLHLSGNSIQSLPDGIKNLKSLTIFKADSNLLTELNREIGGCVALQELVLTSNHITRLPPTIGHLTDLRSLNVDDNGLDYLPPEVGNLRHLGILSLRDNLLTHLPDEIGQLGMVKVMDVSGNRLEYLPTSITALNLKALWLSKNQTQPLPKLQIDEIHNGAQVLTCYLLPQQNESPDENQDAQVERVPVSHVDRAQDAQVVDEDNDQDYNYRKPAAVSFDTTDEGDFDTDGNFVRHDTPHPRELKARHQKLFNNTNGKPELEGHDNASFSMVDSNREPSIEVSHRETREIREIREVVHRESSFGSNHKEPYMDIGHKETDYHTSHREAPQRDLGHLEYNNFRRPEPTISAPNMSHRESTTRHENLHIRPQEQVTIYTTLVKDFKHDLGLVLENNSDEMQIRPSQSNIIIKDILPNSIASRDGKLQINDRLLYINGANVTGVDIESIMSMLEGAVRFVRIVVSRGEQDDPIDAALRDMPARPPLNSWFSSINMSNRPSLIESYQRPTFGSVNSLQKQPQLMGTKPPKPPKPSHLIIKDDSDEPTSGSQFDEAVITRPQSYRDVNSQQLTDEQSTQFRDAERRAAWRRERFKSIDDDLETAKAISEARKMRENK